MGEGYVWMSNSRAYDLLDRGRPKYTGHQLAAEANLFLKRWYGGTLHSSLRLSRKCRIKHGTLRMWSYNNSITAIFLVDAMGQTGGLAEGHNFVLVTYVGPIFWIVRERAAVSMRQSTL